MNSSLFVGTIYSKVATVLKVGIYLHVCTRESYVGVPRYRAGLLSLSFFFFLLQPYLQYCYLGTCIYHVPYR